MNLKQKFTLLYLVLLIGFVPAYFFAKGAPTALKIEPWKIIGSLDAPISITVFTDYTCPYCRNVDPVFKRLVKEFPQTLQVRLKHFPLERIHTNSPRAAEASECAADQGKFWEYHDLVIDKVVNWYDLASPDKTFIGYAKDLRLNETTFQQCLESGVKAGIVKENHEEGVGYMVSGTPTLILNEKRVLPSAGYEYLRDLINEELSKMKAKS